MRSLLLVLALVCLAPSTTAAQEGKKPFPTPDSLAGIARRGLKLAQYDFVAWHATDAVRLADPAMTGVRAYIARQVDSTWTVAFGRMSDDSSAFLIAFEVRQSAERPDSFTISIPPEPRADTGYWARAGRAFATARAAFGAQARPYNIAVMPADAGDWFVWLYPAQVVANCYPLGEDMRYRISGDGRTIRIARRLHNTYREYRGTPPGEDRLVATAHVAVLDDVPEDTDVFHVLVRQPSTPQYVMTDAFMYRIDPNGMLHLLGRREDILK